MRTYTFHVPSSLALRTIALDRSDAPSLTGHTAYTCALPTDAQAIALARTLDCDLLVTRDTDSDDYSRSFGDTSSHRVSSTYNAASRTLTFHLDRLGFEIAYAIGVDGDTTCVQ